MVHLLGEGVGLAEQRAGGRRDERRGPASASRRVAHACARCGRCTCRRPRRAGGTGTGRPSRARGRTSRGTHSARSAASSRVHGVVSVSSTTSEIETATRVTMSAGRVQTLRGEADGVAEPGAERHDDVAVRDDVERRGQHDDAGEDRDEQPHPLHEERRPAAATRPRARASRRSTRPAPATWCTNAGDDAAAPSSVTSFTRGSTRCSRPRLRGDVVGEQRLAQHAGAAVDGLLDEAALAALADAAARAQPDLAAAAASRASAVARHAATCSGRAASRRAGRTAAERGRPRAATTAIDREPTDDAETR